MADEFSDGAPSAGAPVPKLPPGSDSTVALRADLLDDLDAAIVGAAPKPALNRASVPRRKASLGDDFVDVAIDDTPEKKAGTFWPFQKQQPESVPPTTVVVAANQDDDRKGKCRATNLHVAHEQAARLL